MSFSLSPGGTKTRIHYESILIKIFIDLRRFKAKQFENERDPRVTQFLASILRQVHCSDDDGTRVDIGRVDAFARFHQRVVR